MITANLGSSINLLIAIILVSSILLMVLLILYIMCEAYDYVDEKKEKLIEDHKRILSERKNDLKEKVGNDVTIKRKV